jgi:hypothetical protein
MVTKKQFISAYNRNLPNGWTKFIFKYFSKETKIKDTWLKKVFFSILIAYFLAGFIMTAITGETDNKIVGRILLVYGSILIFLVLCGFVAVIMNNIRINKIRKELSLSKEEYNMLSDHIKS